MASNNSCPKASTWAKAKSKTKGAFNKARSGEPVNKFRSGTVPAETYWPKALDKEADKAACMLRSFFIDGYIVPYKTENRVPNDVLRKSKGIALFTVLRNSFRSDNAAGSGILIFRQPNGKWSAPAGLLIQTNDEWGFPEGGDVYDCLCVINEAKAVQAFQTSRCTFGDDVSCGPGPMCGNMNDTEIKKPYAPVWVYVKSKGHEVNAQIKVITIIERSSENERLYGVDGVTNAQILAGEVKAPTGPASQLREVLEAIETLNHNSGKLPSYMKSPGNYILEPPKE